MLKTITSQIIKPFIIMPLGSSSTDGEDTDFFNLPFFSPKTAHSVSHYLTFDIASYFKSISPISENETYKYKGSVFDEMLEYDIFIKMPPKKKYTVRAKITSIRKAKPHIVIPEYPYTGI